MAVNFENENGYTRNWSAIRGFFSTALDVSKEFFGGLLFIACFLILAVFLPLMVIA